MLAALLFALAGLAITGLELPPLMRQRRRRDAMVTAALLLLGGGLPLLGALGVPLPNLIRWIDAAFGPAGAEIARWLNGP